MSKAEKIVKSLLAQADIKINGKRPFDIQVKDDRFYSRVIRDRELGLGESYMNEWWDVEQLDEFITRLLTAGLRDKLKITPELVKVFVLSKVRNRQSVKKAKNNASYHYNIGNDLYQQMLDKRMIYSCAYWKNAKNLNKAQEDKLDLICQKLKLKKGITLLDIGCGWGGFAKFAAENYGVKVVGITPAAEQVKLAQERTKGLSVEIKQLDYRKMNGKFDRIVSIGMLEHVGSKNYKTFFKKCSNMLQPDGIMLHHTIGSNKSVHSTDPWLNKYIFPGGVLPSIHQISKATEKYLIIEDLHNFGPDYDKTLIAWHANFVNNYPKIKTTYNKRFFRMWEYYLLICAASFRARQIQLWQIVMRKPVPSKTYQRVS